MRWPWPQTLFGRLFAALLAAILATLIVLVILVQHERRELAFSESGAGAAVESIADASAYLSKLPPESRAAAIEQLRARPAPQAPRHHASMARHHFAAAQKAFVEELRDKLGPGFQVAAGPHAPGHRVIELQRDRGSDAHEGQEPTPASPNAGDAAHRPPPDHFHHAPPGHMLDLTVTLPDGERVVFRTMTPRGVPPFPLSLIIELGVLTLLLGAVLFVMTRSITKPLHDLALAADAVGRGSKVEPLRERGARELRRATHAFNAMQDRLHRYLDSRTRVLAAMSHDLRTPLTRLRLRIESIEDEALRQRCEDDLEEMTRMVTGALGLFRGLNDQEPAGSIDIDALARELQSQFGEIGGEVRIEGRSQGPYIGKPLAIKRCLSNLIDNALRYGDRATLVIEDGPALTLRVLDEGPGIPAEALDQVFEPFFRLESSRNRNTGGTGLGLSIARDIAQAHGGKLTLANRDGGGLEARLVLPRGDDPPPPGRV
jgi:signal transduction histidine kinase